MQPTSAWFPYDPYYFDFKPKGLFDTIICIYVLNVIESERKRTGVLKDICKLLAPGGHAYFAVRTDKEQLRGHTKRGTWQGVVELELPVLEKSSSYTIYQMEKRT